MAKRIRLHDVEIEVVFKDIKNVHLSVHPPTGRVTVSAPKDTELATIRAFTASRIGWIRRQRHGVAMQEREPPRLYIERESHYLWGRRYLLQVIESESKPEVQHEHAALTLRVRPRMSVSEREEIFARWLRGQVREVVSPMVAKWSARLGEEPSRVLIRKMKTMWGSCTARTKTIRLNTELAKKPPECLEYVLVHEMIHLLVPSHNDRFIAMLDRHLPDWRDRRARLNELPVRAEDWIK